LALLGRDDSAAKKRKKRKTGSRNVSGGRTGSGSGGGSGNGSGNGSGGGSTPTIVGGGSGSRPDRCGGPVGVCDADPTPCGATAEGDVSGCERAVEGNNVCVNSAADNVCDTAVERTSTDGPEAYRTHVAPRAAAAVRPPLLFE
jgi:hypothetical protein